MIYIYEGGGGRLLTLKRKQVRVVLVQFVLFLIEPAQLHSTAFCHSSAVSQGQFNEGPVCSGRDWNNCCFTQCSKHTNIKSDTIRCTMVIWVKQIQNELIVEIYSKSLVRAIDNILCIEFS